MTPRPILRRALGAGLLAATAMVLVGCMVGPDYVRPSAPAQASEADLAAAVLSAQALLAQDYLLLRVQDAQIKLLRDTVAAYAKSLELTSNQYAAGTVSRGDVVQAEAQLKSTQAQVLDA